MQARGRGTILPAVGVAFDGDVGSRVDAWLALAMLNGLAAKGEARRISLTVSRPSLKAAQLADVVSSFYAGRPAGGSTGGVGAITEGMIGMPDGPGALTDTPPLAAVLSRKEADGTPTYVSSIAGLVSTAETSILIRNLLLAQNDQNAIIIMVGPATGMARMPALYRSGPQITSKVRQLVVALGSFGGSVVDPAVKADISAARKLFAEWPTSLIAVGTEVGEALPYPGASIETDLGWSQTHPVLDAYRLFKTMPYDAPAAGLAAVLQAIQPNAGYFKLSDPGTITVLDDGRTQFTPGADGKHRYLIADPSQKDQVTKLYVEMVSAKPAPRPGRGGRGAAPQQQQQQQQQAPAAVPTPVATPPAPPAATP